MGLGAGLMALALAVQIFGRMDTRTLVKGGIVVTAFTGLIVGLMAATQLLGEQSKNLGKFDDARFLDFIATYIRVYSRSKPYKWEKSC